MSELKYLVPPLKLCRKIPAGSFENSCFVRPAGVPGNPVWSRGSYVCSHELRCGIELFPAPTLVEISEELSDYGNVFMRRDADGWMIMFENPGDDEGYGCDAKIERNSHHPAAAALRLWLEITKEVERC